MNRIDRIPHSRLDKPGAVSPKPDGEPRGKGGFFSSLNLITIAIAMAVMYHLFPHFTQRVVFHLGIRHCWYVVPVAAILWYCLRYFYRNRDDFEGLKLGKHRRPIAVVATATTATVLWCMGVYAATDYFTYKMFASKFSSRDDLVISSPDFVRYTPLTNACNDLASSISTTGEHIDCAYVAPIITDKGFGYAAPITPSGTLNTYVKNNPGFKVLEDSFKVDSDPDKRLRRIDDTQYYGPGMEWFDNLYYVLAKTDFLATFDRPHYLALDPAKPDKLTLVVPKIKYAMLWLLPYWGGVVLVHSDGQIENLSAEQAMADSRLKGKWIYPLALARLYVQLQNYAIGWGIATPYVYIQGKLEVEGLPGGNQFPFLTQGDDGRSYLVTAAKGQGSARGLQKMFFTDASTGVVSFHQFGNHEVVYGAGASLDRITNIPNYQWYHSGEKGGGSIIATEPVYVVRRQDPKKMYWKYTITNIKNSGISATAVVDSARPDDIKLFTHRAEYEAWLNGAESTAAARTKDKGLREELIGEIESLMQKLNALKKRVETLPAR